jgi:hypothetical protein
MYFSGKTPLIVAGTSPPTASRGVGFTLKLSALRLPNLLQELIIAALATTNARSKLFFILFINMVKFDIIANDNSISRAKIQKKSHLSATA